MSPIFYSLVILSSILALELFAETSADLNQVGTGSENNSNSEKIAFVALPSQLTSTKNKRLKESTKASTEVELERSLDMTTSSLKAEQESKSPNRDLKGAREDQTFRWFEECANSDDLCSAQEDKQRFFRALYD